jgi:hypothetical protein
MTAALLAGITGILGIAIGKLWENRSESFRWRRDQKVRSYQRLAEAFRKIYENTRTVALARPDTVVFVDSVDRARRDDSWDNALAAVWLHGAPAVVTAATRMDMEVTSLFYDAQKNLFSIEDWNRARTSSRDAFEFFIRSVRDDLDLPPVQIRLFSDGPSDLI